jgi:hypothetical protein
VGLFGGKLPSFAIELERADGVYFPGETVRARITVTAEDAAKFRELRAGLLLFEKYQAIEESRDSDGDRSYSRVWRESEQWAAKEIIATGELPAGFRRTYHYEWQLPVNAAPYNDGKIINARWLVKVTMDRKLARDVNQEAVLYVIVPPTGTQMQPGEYVEETNAAEAVSLRFALPRLEFVQGETFNGRLLIEPHKEIKPRALRIELGRKEVVPVGDRTNVERVVEQVQTFNVGTLQPGTPSALDFTLTIPPKWCPTYRSHKGDATWYVIATLDIPWGTDFIASQSIAVFNGVAPDGWQGSAPEATQTAPDADAPAPGASDFTGVTIYDDPALADMGGPTAQPHEAALPLQKFCVRCGAQLQPGIRFCGNCGQQVPQA